MDLLEHEILLKVHVPFTRQHEYVKEFKQAHRRDDDIAIVNAGMRFQMGQAEGEQCVLLSASGVGTVCCWQSVGVASRWVVLGVSDVQLLWG